MALIKCNECGKEISDSAKTCIHCGYKLKKKNEKKRAIPATTIYTISFIGVILFLIIGFIIYNSYKENKTIKKLNQIVGTWNYTARNPNGTITYSSIAFAENGKCKIEDALYYEGKTILPQNYECTWEGGENVGGWFSINTYVNEEIIYQYRYYNDFDELVRYDQQQQTKEKFQRKK